MLSVDTIKINTLKNTQIVGRYTISKNNKVVVLVEFTGRQGE